jgi:phospholipid/cholesterol/gamma-HCH transport system substrate-binding protein
VWRVTTFTVVCAVGAFALIAVFAQLRFDDTKAYNAVFSNVSGLKKGNLVRIAGVEVGKVSDIAINDDATVRVAFTADDTVVLTQGTRAVIKYDDLIGGRYLALEDGTGTVNRLPPGATIPADHTEPALDLDALIGGFRPLFRALDPEQVNALSGQLISAFQGQGVTIGSILSQTAALTSTLADRDALIGQVVVNLNTVLGALGDHSDKFGLAVDSLSSLVHGLEARQQDIVNGVAYANAAASSISDLLDQARPPLQKVVHETDRSAGLILADHDYFDNLLKTLPDAYRVIGRQGLAGDYFSFYLCDVLLKVNGKGGQPVYVKVVGQDTGRCTPQ